MSDESPDFNKVMGHAAVIGFEKLTKPQFDKVRDAWLKAKFRSGFTPTPKEASRLKDIAGNRTYIAFKSCVGAVPYLRFIKVGILLYELMCEGNIKRIREIKREIYNSKYNKTAIKIIHIASTGILLNALEYLINLRDNRNLSKYAVSLEFEKIQELWQEASVGIKKDETVEQAEEKIMNKVKKLLPLVIAYASQTAVIIAQSAVANIRNKGICQGKYLPWSKNLVYCDLEQYLCIFYKVGGEFETPFG